MAEDSIGCGNARAEVDVTPTGSRDVSPMLFHLAAPFLEALYELSTGCGSGRRGLLGLAGLVGLSKASHSWDALELRLLRCVSSIGCGRGLRGDGGDCGSMTLLSYPQPCGLAVVDEV